MLCVLRERQRKQKQKKWAHVYSHRYEKNQVYRLIPPFERNLNVFCCLVSLQPQKSREPSVKISSEWAVVHEIDFTQLAKLNYSPGAPREL